MNKIIICVILLFFVSRQVYSDPVDLETAKKVAVNFYYEKINEFVATDYYDIQIASSETVKSGEDPVYYIFNFVNTGFTMVSVDDNTIPILAYSFESSYDGNNGSPAFSEWIDALADEILKASDDNSVNNWKAAAMWKKYLNLEIKEYFPLRSRNVKPLLKTYWDQNKWYNEMCPETPNGPGGHMPAGCVSTAMAQILKYYEYPETGAGSYTLSDWRWPEGLLADFGNTVYNWSNMPAMLNESNFDVANLIYQCGVGVNTHYFYTESGASISDAKDVFYSYFKYRMPEYVEREDFKDNEWTRLLKYDLDMGRPILYAGSGTSGHAFVCDGYQDSNYFHFNWGWSGSNNGYFYIDDLTPYDYDFSEKQRALTQIMPPYCPYCDGLVVYDDTSVVFHDGSGANYYINNTNCSWLIAPKDSDVVITLSFNYFNTESKVDILSVYDGEDASAPLIGSYSGDEVPEPVVSTGSKLYLTFHSDDENPDHGWNAQYTTSKASGLFEQELEENTITFNNPAYNILHITGIGLEEEHGSIRLFALSGKEVLVKDFAFRGTSGKIDLDVSSLSPGLYVLALTTGEKVLNKKLMVQ